MPTEGHSKPRWHTAANAEDWLALALGFVAAAESEALDARGMFHLVLAGGGTPEKLYQALADQAHAWDRWQIWFGDERCLPPEDRERNSHMARQAWLEKVGLPAGNLHVIPAELGAQTAARIYAEALAGVPVFDLVLLGLGQDGHTASLFPGQPLGDAPGSAEVLAVDGAPKPPRWRVSMSVDRLSRSRRVLFLVAGTDKRPALARWRAGDVLPAAAIRPPAGVDILMDTDASPNGEA